MNEYTILMLHSIHIHIRIADTRTMQRLRIL